MPRFITTFILIVLLSFPAMTFAQQGGIQFNETINRAPTCGPCVVNKAVYPNGDPNCVNGYYKYDIYTGKSCSAINTLNVISCNISSPKTFKDFVTNLLIGCLIRPLYPLLMSLAVIAFIWGVFKFIRAEDDKGKSEGRKFVIWGIIGLFVLVSVWGLVNILQYTFRLDNSSINVRQISQ